MANPYNVNVTDARLAVGTLWSPEVSLALLRRDFGMIERPFHFYLPEVSAAVTSGSWTGFGTTGTLEDVTWPASLDLADTGISLQWRIGVFIQAKRDAAAPAQVRITATNATNHQHVAGVTTSYVEYETWCEGTTWPPGTISFQKAWVTSGTTAYIKRDWTDKAADCYLMIDEV